MKQVLVVDDNRLILHGLAEYLRLFSKGFNVVTAEDGKAAVRILETSPIDAVVTDLSMHAIGGYKLLAYTRENYPLIPIFAITALHNSHLEQSLQRLGVIYCIRKHNVRELALKILDKLSLSVDGHA